MNRNREDRIAHLNKTFGDRFSNNNAAKAEAKYRAKWIWTDADGPSFASLGKAYENAKQATVSLIETKERLQKSKNYTPTGLRQQLIDFTSMNTIPMLAHARKKALPAAKQEVANLQQQLEVEGPDKTDVAGAMLRSEIRSWLRGLDLKERNALLKTPPEGAEETDMDWRDVDPLIALSVIEAPAALSGTIDMVRDRLVTQGLKKLHPEKIEKIENLQLAINVVEHALKTADKEHTGALGYGDRDFAKIIKEWDVADDDLDENETPADPITGKTLSDSIRDLIEGKTVTL